MSDTMHVGWDCDALEQRIKGLQSEVEETESILALKRAKLVRLQRIQQDLLEEFGPVLEVPMKDPLGSMAIEAISANAQPNRKEQIARFLLANGPKKRSEIVECTKIPSGTVAFEMRDSRVFHGENRGAWDVVDDIRQRYQANPNMPLNLPMSHRYKQQRNGSNIVPG